MKKFYPSAASFAVGSQSHSEKSSGCFRNILIKGAGIREPDIDPKYMLLGSTFEDHIAKDLKGNVQKEVPFRLDCGDDVVISGRCDFLTDDIVIECKATRSAFLKAQIRKGIPVQDHVAQLILYMSHFERDCGHLYYGLYPDEDAKRKKEVEIHCFEIFITDENEIEINGEIYSWNMDQFEDFIKTAIQVLKKDTLLGRPYKALDFNSPCKYCVFSPVCDKLDDGSIKGAKAFLKEAQLRIEQLVKERANESTKVETEEA